MNNLTRAGAIDATLPAMSEDEAGTIARRISELYRALDRLS